MRKSQGFDFIRPLCLLLCIGVELFLGLLLYILPIAFLHPLAIVLAIVSFVGIWVSLEGIVSRN